MRVSTKNNNESGNLGSNSTLATTCGALLGFSEEVLYSILTNIYLFEKQAHYIFSDCCFGSGRQSENAALR